MLKPEQSGKQHGDISDTGSITDVVSQGALYLT